MSAFRLAGLRRLRRLQEDQAAAELARSTAQRQRAEKRTENARAQLAGSDLGNGGSALIFQAAVAARAAMSSTVLAAQAAAEVAQAQEGQAQGEWSQARARTKTLDKLAERHLAAQRQAEGRAEQHTLDELATQRATRRKEDS
ncbi:flagellar FliJ family protein [Georgenia sp. SYP-B2076]|uniref:flagellar FliJ family protein n=1 Tax=Georgenia sp. SYP-B2076 TaxID=2495881 RepID=UPI0013DF1B0C|nr:flagellar FliJ family protein [Georgenia sp. SYP-B2076]